ncbi:MAG: helix-turn-helix transcriptional regulator [Burkholderiaceae bacterium]|nr:helix-turn-helix transcriptional regulator [Burkholderiaceae bacterium]
MKARGVHLQYRFEASEQRGAALHNPLFELLSAVREHGSIQHATKALGASYRHVWGALKRWEEVLGEPLLHWRKGEPARLTAFAERLLWAETRARTRLTPHIEALRAELERVLAEALDGDQQLLTIYASHDLALPHLRELAAEPTDGGARLHIELRFAGSVDALQALAEGRCLVAGFHVPALPGGSAEFSRAMKPRLQPGRHKLIGCLRRSQGLMVAPGNPLRLQGLADLARPGLRWVNRQPGSGTRLLMDHLLAEAGLATNQAGPMPVLQEDSHVAVAAAVASGSADAGPGIAAAARQFGLDFLPLIDEDYYLVCLKDALEHPAVLRLRQLLAGPDWARLLGRADLPGYAPAAQPGAVLSLTQALPWWHFRQAKKADGPQAEPAPSSTA